MSRSHANHSEDRSRKNIDKLLTDEGWIVQDKRTVNLSAGRGVAIREFPLKPGHGEADYLLFIDSAPIAVIEAKREGVSSRVLNSKPQSTPRASQII